VEIEIRDGSNWSIARHRCTHHGIPARHLAEVGPVEQRQEKALRTLGSVEVRISKSGRTTEFLTAYIIKNFQQPILSRQVLQELGIIPEKFPFVQLSIGNGADFGAESIEKLEEAPRQAWAKWGIYISAALTSSRIKLGHGPKLDKIANEFPKVFDNTKIPMTIELEETATPFNKGSSNRSRLAKKASGTIVLEPKKDKSSGCESTSGCSTSSPKGR
jgi:hypothetical protein